MGEDGGSGGSPEAAGFGVGRVTDAFGKGFERFGAGGEVAGEVGLKFGEDVQTGVGVGVELVEAVLVDEIRGAGFGRVDVEVRES